jgi:hypothetical protein
MYTLLLSSKAKGLHPKLSQHFVWKVEIWMGSLESHDVSILFIIERGSKIFGGKHEILLFLIHFGQVT